MSDVMKRKSKFFVWGMVVCLVVAAFVSCSKTKSTLNDFGFYEDLDEAKKIAKKQKKDILLAVGMEGYDYFSKEFKENILMSEKFDSVLGDKFVGVYFDFGEAAYGATEVKPGATKDEQDAAEEKSALIFKNMQLTRLLNIQYTPVVFVMTEDGYCVGRLEYSENFESVQEFANEVNACNDDLSKIKSLVHETKKGSVIERMNAMNSIYEFANEFGTVTYSTLFKQTIEIDKNNESGLVSKIYFEGILADCMSYYSVGDFGSAIKVLLAAAQSGKLDPAEKQEAYYMAGYLLVTAGSDDFETILGYFTLAVQADPNGENVAGIQEIINTISSLVAPEDEGEN